MSTDHVPGRSRVSAVPDDGKDPTGPPGRPRLTLSEAATATGVSRSTLRRRVESGRYATAVRDPVRGWLVPVEELLGDGLTLTTIGRSVSALTAPVSALSERAHNGSAEVSGSEGVRDGPLNGRAHRDGVGGPTVVELAEQAQRVAVLEAELRGAREVIVEVRHRAETAERALLMLTDGRVPDLAAAVAGAEAGAVSEVALPGRPRWWQRRGR